MVVVIVMGIVMMIWPNYKGDDWVLAMIMMIVTGDDGDGGGAMISTK